MVEHYCESHDACVETALAKAELICSDKNVSLTAIRKKVLEVIWQENHAAIKAYAVLDKLRAENPSLQPIAIYRAINFLLEHHLVHKIESQNSYIGCSHPLCQHQCIFLICTHCLQVEECCQTETIPEAIAKVAGARKFSVTSATLEIYGLCRKCG